MDERPRELRALPRALRHRVRAPAQSCRGGLVAREVRRRHHFPSVYVGRLCQVGCVLGFRGGLQWTGLGWAGLRCALLGWIGLRFAGLVWAWLCWAWLCWTWLCCAGLLSVAVLGCTRLSWNLFCAVLLSKSWTFGQFFPTFNLGNV